MNGKDEIPTPGPVKIGAVVGLLGGALFASIDGFVCLLDRVAAAMPRFPAPRELLALVAGLSLLAVPIALGGALYLALAGMVIRLCRLPFKARFGAERMAALHVALLAAGACLLAMVDRLGLDGLLQAQGPWPPVMLAVVTLLAASASWLLFRSMSRGWQKGRGLPFRPLRWAATRNLAIIVLLVMCLLPSGFLVGRHLAAPDEDPAPDPTPSAAGRPNILLVTVDTLRADHLGAYGYEEARTGSIDALAAGGLTFDQATVQSPWTFPSFASILTSRYPGELGLACGDTLFAEIQRRRVDAEERILAEELKDAGYCTAAVLTNPWLLPHFGLIQGFDDFIPVDERQFHHIAGLKNLTVLKLSHRFPIADRWLRTLYEWITGPAGEAAVMEVCAERVTEEAVRWLRDRRRAPFFLWVHYVDPHCPFDPPEAFQPDLADFPAERREFLTSYNAEDIHTGLARLTRRDREALAALYDAEIAYVDECVGELFAELETLGLAGDTLVIFTSDHGEEFWDHGGYQHGHTLYDELIRVPLIFRGPGVKAVPRRVAADVRLLDLMPTLLELAGRPPPPGTRGRSLAPHLAGEAGGQLEDVFAFSEGLYLTEERKAVRGNGLKLIYRPGSEEYELYDLAKDPGERQDISQSRLEDFERMRSLLNDWLRSEGF